MALIELNQDFAESHMFQAKRTASHDVPAVGNTNTQNKHNNTTHKHAQGQWKGTHTCIHAYTNEAREEEKEGDARAGAQVSRTNDGTGSEKGYINERATTNTNADIHAHRHTDKYNTEGRRRKRMNRMMSGTGTNQ